LRRGAACICETPGWRVEIQRIANGLGHTGRCRAQYRGLQFPYL
jgi:hypothetical protein